MLFENVHLLKNKNLTICVQSWYRKTTYSFSPIHSETNGMIEQYNERMIEDRLESFNFNFCQELENHSESIYLILYL